MKGFFGMCRERERERNVAGAVAVAVAVRDVSTAS